jgi:hypothetical protein
MVAPLLVSGPRSLGQGLIMERRGHVDVDADQTISSKRRAPSSRLWKSSFYLTNIKAAWPVFLLIASHLSLKSGRAS